ncbi:hypothetical protein D9M68_690100 [compost metagenome]
MRHLMGHHVERASEAVEDFPIAVTENHLRTVPEGVLVIVPIVHGADQRKAAIIDRVAPEYLPEELMGGAKRVIGFIRRRIASGLLAFDARGHAGQLHQALRIMNAAPRLPRPATFRHHRGQRLPARRARVVQ